MKTLKRRNISTTSTQYGDQREGSDPSVGSYSLNNSASSHDASNSVSNTTNGVAESSSSPDQDTPRRKFSVGTVMSLNNITNSNSSPPDPDTVSDNENNKYIVQKRGRTLESKGKRWISVNPNNSITGEPPPSSLNESTGSELNHLDQLVLGMIQLFLSYNPSNDSSTPSTSATSDSSNNNSTSCNGNSDSPPDPSVSSEKIKHEIITTLRNAMPLNYLQEVCKKNGIGSIRWFPCTHERCFNLYLSKGSQRRHTYSHTGERPYTCKFPGCDKSYSASDRLAEHMHSHTNQRPYRCTFIGCPKAYNDPKTLREHKRTHGEKTFTCTVPLCGKSFHRKTHLKQHLRTHNNEESGPFMEAPEPQSKTPPQSGTSMHHRSLLNNSTDAHFQVNRSFPPS